MQPQFSAAGPERDFKPLTKPLRITEQQWPEGTVPLVSITCITYNHSSFIRHAIEGFLMQETTFPVEIIIHDDASGDGTADIVREYEMAHPGLITAICQTENQYSQGKGLGSAVRPLQRGKYVAFCEGDDYWTDNTKLQRQISFLESNREYSATSENSLWLDVDSNTTRLFGTGPERDITIGEMLAIRPFGTASVVARSESLRGKEKVFKVAGDIGTWCYLAKNGNIKYFPNVSSIYRRGAHGLVMGTPKLTWAGKMEEWNRELAVFLKGEVPQSVFNRRIFRNYYSVFVQAANAGDVHSGLKAAAKAFRYRPLEFLKNAGVASLKKGLGVLPIFRSVRKL